ncbi:MAG: SDR family oxidoreductase [Pseudomonadota bacterium]
MDFKNQVAVVTGGADGIGLAAAQKFKDLGATVVIADIDAAKVQAQAGAFGFEGVVCDVTSADDIAHLATTAKSLGEVGCVMANAGVAVGGRFEVIPSEEWQRLFDVNVHGVVRTINAFLPDLLQRGSGRIVVTGSSAGLFFSDGFNVPYAASKHALRALAQGLQSYCVDAGVAIHYLAPRITDTAFPRSSVAWGKRGRRITEDRDIGRDFDTVDSVVDALIAGIVQQKFTISLTADTEQRMHEEVSNLVSHSC